MKTLVTGATGYIGSHICKHLQMQGHQVTGVDRVPREHTEKFMHEFLHADYASTDMFDWLETNLPDAVIHCAGTSLVGPSMIDPAEYHVNNVAKTAYFLAGLRELPNMPLFVFSSSAAVYGAPDVETIHENHPWAPMSPYGQSKAAIEIMLADYAMAYEARVLSLRYFNACGADVAGARLGQAPGATHIIARLLEAQRDHKGFTLYGNDYSTPDGTCIRDYVHVDDIARAHVMALDYLQASGRSGAMNLGSSRGYSNQEIVDAVARIIGPVDITIGPRRAGDPDRLVASNDIATEALGWIPQHSELEIIINSAWKWYNNPSLTIDDSSK